MSGDPRGAGIPFNGLYRVVPPDMGTFFRLNVFQRVENLELRYVKGFTEIHHSSIFKKDPLINKNSSKKRTLWLCPIR